MKYLAIILISITFLFTSCKKECVANDGLECLCATVYDPVCGCDGITYPSDCNAECVGITEYTKGQCN